MKACLLIPFTAGLALSITTGLLGAQEYHTIEIGPHHRIVQRVTPDSHRRSGFRTNQITIKATGLYYWSEGEWKETQELVEIIINGVATARQGPHQVIFPNDVLGDVDLLTPDAKRMRSRVVGLLYFDSESGASVPLASVKSSAGAVVLPNQVYYLNAFDGGGITADVRLVYQRSGLFQGVVLRTAPAPPADYGLNADTTTLRLVTEFIEAPEPTIQTVVLRQEMDPAKRQQMAEPDWVDERLDWGTMKTSWGRALATASSDWFSRIRVVKDWSVVAGRRYLSIVAKYRELEPLLRELPGAQAGIDRRKAKIQNLVEAFPIRPSAGDPKPMQLLAQADLPKDGVVLDYNLHSSETNFTFTGDNGIVGPTFLYGTTTTEANSVIKYTNYAASPYLQIEGPMLCNTSLMAPAVFTGFDDDSIGSVAVGSSGNPSGKCYASMALLLNSAGDSYALHDLHIRYADYGILSALKSSAITNVQLGFCTNAIYNLAPELRIDNALIYNSTYAFVGFSDATNHCQNVTFDQLSALVAGSTVRLTNCLIASVTNGLLYTGTNNVTTNNAGFVTVGEGTHYLSLTSPYLDQGTAVSPGLAEALAKQTVHPPFILTNLIRFDRTLVPQVRRDTNAIDLGYHAPPIDVVAHEVVVTNANLRLLKGMVIGTYGDSDGSGIFLENGSSFTARGSPMEPCWVVRCNLIQEHANTSWSSSSAAPSIRTVDHNVATHPTFDVQFVNWSMPAADAEHVFGGFEDIPELSFKDCQFYSGRLYSDYPAMAFTNCLFDRVEASINSIGGHFYNNTFYRGTLSMDAVVGEFRLHDNFFDRTVLNQNGAAVTNSANGFVEGTPAMGTNYLSPTNATSVYLTNTPTYAVGALGRFYYPTNDGMLSTLVEKGSRNSTNAGLFHYTVRVDNLKETNSTVDIGFHSIAIANGVPIDIESDTLADYFEDTNGDGLPNDLTSWLSADDFTNNVLVNSPWDEYGNERNSQFESSMAILNGNIIVGFVDSNLGVYGLGGYYDNYLPNRSPQMVGYAVSRDGGVTFQDMGVPPLSRPEDPANDDGVAADPVLAVDEAAEVVYLVGTSPRHHGYYGVPVWKSFDSGVTFENPTNVLNAITNSDKPWIAVDNFSGIGQPDVYVTCGGMLGSSPNTTNGIWFTVSTNGTGTDWSSPRLIRKNTNPATADVVTVGGSIVLPSPNHTAYAFWTESSGFDFPAATNWLKMCQILNRGATTGEVHTVVQLASTYYYHTDKLTRSNTSPTNDFFTAPTSLPVPVVDPLRSNYLYVAFADRGTNATDKADVYLTTSTNAGLNWTAKRRINGDSTTNDQWMPTLTVKPDGTRLLLSWYDRRNDTNNSLIDFYGIFGSISNNGSVGFSTEFKITTTNFPPVFGGTTKTNIGEYDPVWAPEGISLYWYYHPDWSNAASGPQPVTPKTYNGHVGEYNGAVSDNTFVYLTWTDNRLFSPGTTNVNRRQPDIRFVKLWWP